MNDTLASELENKRFAEIALPLPLRKLFTYRLPSGFANITKPGARVSVPFGRQKLIGYIINFRPDIDPETHLRESDIKDVDELLDEDPLLSGEIMQLTKWAADYYATSWGEMLKASLPAGISSSTRIKPKRRKSISLLPGETEPEIIEKLSEQQRAVLRLLQANGGEMLFTDVLELAGVGASPVNTLAKRGLVEVGIREVYRDPLAKFGVEIASDLELTPAQADSLFEIETALSSNTYTAFLLHGITGSGKTEVYIRAMRAALANDKSSLMLVPEISLTPVFSRRLRAVFGEEVAILHSNLSTGERYDEWRRIRNGDARVVIGTRSAVFAPLNHLGLIIVDEEHDSSYRQNEMPYYHGRDLAVMRANMSNAVIILGSATPSMETFDNAHSGKYRHLKLPGRIGGRPLAKAELVDMREVFKKTGKDVVLSPKLISAIEETHAKGEQSMILLNRRGFSTFVLCRSCGESLRCKNCDITMTYHRRDGHLICHYCSYAVNTPSVCPFCEGEFLYFIGQGTEQVEGILRKRFPQLTIARIDRDSMKRKGEMARTLDAFDRGEIDILLGTQMIAKGHDFHNVTLVGVVSVDTGLGLPDFRSAERTFQLLTQVAGRAGRGSLPGIVLIQSYYPEHYALRFAVDQDFDEFYNEEMKYRQRLGYPPYFVLASIMIIHRKLEYAEKNARLLRDSLDRANLDKRTRILGPAQASIARIKNQYRQQIILKAENRRELRAMLDAALAEAETLGCDLRIIQVEIDPVNLM
jgi:primosomal protein N' (replication factor Y) (superfamily II helicase)